MNLHEAVAFLREHQPLPADDDIDQAVLDTFDDVRRFLIANPDPACVPLLLGAFGDGMGFGVYQVCDDCFRHFSNEQLAPHLGHALFSPKASTRWCAWRVGGGIRSALSRVLRFTRSAHSLSSRLLTTDARVLPRRCSRVPSERGIRGSVGARVS